MGVSDNKKLGYSHHTLPQKAKNAEIKLKNKCRTVNRTVIVFCYFF